jgi:hypothetical protein
MLSFEKHGLRVHVHIHMHDLYNTPYLLRFSLSKKTHWASALRTFFCENCVLKVILCFSFKIMYSFFMVFWINVSFFNQEMFSINAVFFLKTWTLSKKNHLHFESNTVSSRTYCVLLRSTCCKYMYIQIYVYIIFLKHSIYSFKHAPCWIQKTASAREAQLFFTRMEWWLIQLCIFQWM